MLTRLIGEASRIVVFTGAGISTESGIPDFRSPGGIWSKYAPIQYDDFMSSAEMRRESWRRKFATDAVMANAEPNRGHRAVEKLVRDGKVACVITQNVDGLHQKSGVPADKVVELHGNATFAKCQNCGAHHELAWVKEIFEDTGEPPPCTACGGIVKTATISFGQAMPEEEMIRAQEETVACDLFLVMGSSLVVYPAAAFPLVAKKQGARLGILNRDPTDHDAYADLVINDEIGPVLGDVVGVN